MCVCVSSVHTHRVWKAGQEKFLALRQDRTSIGTIGPRGTTLTLNQSAMKLGSSRCSRFRDGASAWLKSCLTSDTTALRSYGRMRSMVLRSSLK